MIPLEGLLGELPMPRIAVLALTALALTGCQSPKPPEAVQSLAAAAEPDRPAPARRPGLWSQSLSMSGLIQTALICIDRATDARLSLVGAQATSGDCDLRAITPEQAGWRFQSVCDMGSGGRTMTSGTATGDFASRYVVRARSTTSGAAVPQMNGTHSFTAVATWEGSCPAGMRPGDMSLPGSLTVNLLTLKPG